MGGLFEGCGRFLFINQNRNFGSNSNSHHIINKKKEHWEVLAVCPGVWAFSLITLKSVFRSLCYRNFGPHIISIVLLDEKMILGGVGGLSGGVGVFLLSLKIVILVLMSLCHE